MKDFGEKIGGSKKDLYKGAAVTGGITKNDVWPPIKETEGDRKLNYFRNEVRKALNSCPKADPEEYCEGIKYFQELSQNMDTFFETIFEKEVVFQKAGRHMWTCRPQFVNILKGGGRPMAALWNDFRDGSMVRKMKESGYGLEKEEKVTFLFPIAEDVTATSFGCEYQGKIFSGKYSGEKACLLDRKKRKILFAGSVEECKEMRKNMNKKVSWALPSLIDLQRIGRNIPQNISPDEFLGTFAFRAGEFGNWVGQKERQEFLQMTYEAMWDMAEVLNISKRDMGLDGLAISFGSRGKSAALAHFEVGKNVINLTRKNGAGSLAHEWGHALDSMIAQGDGFASHSAHKIPAVKRVMDSIMYDGNGYYSQYYRNSRKFGQTLKKEKYWISKEELFARAFACYVSDKLSEKGQKNDFLCGHAECAVLGDPAAGIIAYPTGEERKQINAAFDNLFDDLKKENILHAPRIDFCQEQSGQLFFTF